VGSSVRDMESRLDQRRLQTICREACCPNQGECFSKGIATFLLMGSRCSRDCRFCAVDSGTPQPLDEQEPWRLAEEVGRLGLRFVVVTSVTRDDLPDGGAGHFTRAIETLHHRRPHVGVEVLIPDFQGRRRDLQTIVKAAPDVLNHNLETVSRLYPSVRPKADYRRSLALLGEAKRMNPSLITKSGLMLGLGETRQEVLESMADLRAVHCDVLTIGQYLSPSASHLPVEEYVTPEVFENYRKQALQLGFRGVASAPFVRSSYMAELVFRPLFHQTGQPRDDRRIPKAEE
jgi:lipoic acid synthetase